MNVLEIDELPIYNQTPCFSKACYFSYMKSNDIYRCLLTLIDSLEISLLHTITSIVTTLLIIEVGARAI